MMNVRTWLEMSMKESIRPYFSARQGRGGRNCKKKAIRGTLRGLENQQIAQREQEKGPRRGDEEMDR